jgi:hypothetical protein
MTVVICEIVGGTCALAGLTLLLWKLHVINLLKWFQQYFPQASFKGDFASDEKQWRIEKPWGSIWLGCGPLREFVIISTKKGGHLQVGTGSLLWCVKLGHK